MIADTTTKDIVESDKKEENGIKDDKNLGVQLKREALETLEEDPELYMLLHQTILALDVITFEDAVASTVCYCMLMMPCGGGGCGKDQNLQFCPKVLRSILNDAF